MTTKSRFAVPSLFLALSLAVVGYSTSQVACTAAQGGPIVQSVPPLVACIIQAAGSDFVEALSDPLTLLPVIAQACLQYGAVTAEAIVSAIESWFAGTPAVDAGSGSVQAARLKNVHDVFVAAIAAKAHR